MICKITKKKLKPFMSFGKMPIANGFIKKKDFKKEFFFKMEVGFSKDLSLFQLNDHPKPKAMFNKNYPFFTGSSKGMIKHFKEYSDWIKRYYLKKGNNLIEIGHKINERSSLGRMDCILIENGILEGGADKRGDNTAIGY